MAAGRRSTSVQADDAMESQPPRPEPRELFSEGYIDIAAAMSQPPPDLNFVLPGLLEGTLGVLVSPGGAGKSMLALQASVAVARGGGPWGLFKDSVPQGKVLIVNAEDPAQIIIRRLHSLKENLGHIFDGDTLEHMKIKAVQGTGFSFGSWVDGAFQRSDAFKHLSDEIDAYAPDLVIYDTLNRCAAGINENDNASMGALLSDVEAVHKAVGASGLILHHISKGTALGGQGGEQQASRGASAITDNCRWQMNLQTMTAEDAEQRGLDDIQRKSWIRSMITKANYSAPFEDRWLKRGEGGFLSGNVPPEAVQSRKSGKKHPKTGGSEEVPW